MVKRQVSLNLTDEYIEELKRRGVNISAQVDEYLAVLVRLPAGSEPAPGSRGPRSEKIERVLEKELKRERLARGQAKFEARLKPFRDYYKSRSAALGGTLKWGHDARMRWLKATADNLGLKVPKLLKLLEPGPKKRRC